MTDERDVDKTQLDQAAVQSDSELGRPTELPTDSSPEDAGTEDEVEPHKAQWDLTVDELRGDARSEHDE